MAIQIQPSAKSPKADAEDKTPVSKKGIIIRKERMTLDAEKNTVEAVPHLKTSRATISPNDSSGTVVSILIFTIVLLSVAFFKMYSGPFLRFVLNDCLKIEALLE